MLLVAAVALQFVSKRQREVHSRFVDALGSFLHKLLLILKLNINKQLCSSGCLLLLFTQNAKSVLCASSYKS